MKRFRATNVHSVAVLVINLIGVAIASQGREPAEQILDCYNTNQPWEPFTFNEFKEGKPTRMRMHTVFWSTKHLNCSTPGPCQSVLTVITALSVHRLSALEAQCRSWPGPLVAAVYVPLVDTTGSKIMSDENKQALARASEEVSAVFHRMEAAPQHCAMRMLVVYEALREAVLGQMLPINALRNAALLAADTPLVAMLDVDMMASASLAADVLGNQRKARELERTCRDRHALILPAFETARKPQGDPLGVLLTERCVAGSKEGLIQVVKEGSLMPFGQSYCFAGHQATDFDRWYTAVWPYKVPYAVNFEPWYIIDRKASPPYDVRYRGYGHNKQHQVAHVAHSGFTLLVHPDAFVVHRPHPRSDAQLLHDLSVNARTAAGEKAPEFVLSSSSSRAGRKMLQSEDDLLKGRGHLDLMDKLYSDSLKEMQAGTYKPVTEAHARRCIEQLPWWEGKRRQQ